MKRASLSCLLMLLATTSVGQQPHPDAIPNTHSPGEVDVPGNQAYTIKDPGTLEGIVLDETAAQLKGSWQYSTHTPPYVGIGYLHDQKKAKGEKAVTWPLNLPEAGYYEVRISHCYNVRRSTRTPITISHANGSTTVRINQQQIPEHGKLFRSLGVFRFNPEGGFVRISNDGTEPDKVAIADAVQLIPRTRRTLTLAGSGTPGFSGDGGPANKAEINNPFGVVIGPDGALYLCDTGNHAVRRIDPKTGIISTVAGTGGREGYAGDGGPATEALLNEPYEVRFDRDGDLFFVEMSNHLIRRVDAKTGVISTVAGTGEPGFSGDGGPATNARFNRPHSIQFDTNGDLYVCDISNHRIRKIDMDTGKVSTFCGTGKREGPEDGASISPETPLKGPRALDIDEHGDFWLALREGNKVFRLDMKKRTFHHMAGTGKRGFSGHGADAKLATLSGPKGIALDPRGWVYLADTESHTVRAVNLSTTPPRLKLIAGTGKPGNGTSSDPLACAMKRPHGIYCDPKTQDVYVGDSEAHRVRVIRFE